VEVDSAGAGRADQWHRYQDDTLTLVEQDRDGDGKVDHMVHYEAPGRVAQVWENLDATGKPRTRLIYESGALVRGEFDTTGNGQVNQWLFQVNQWLFYDAEGHVIRAEYDQHARGRPDQWEFFTPGSKEPFKVERDTNGDGKADAVWEKGASASKSRR
jgi:hypothetical protein